MKSGASGSFIKGVLQNSNLVNPPIGSITYAYAQTTITALSPGGCSGELQLIYNGNVVKSTPINSTGAYKTATFEGGDKQYTMNPLGNSNCSSESDSNDLIYVEYYIFVIGAG